MRRGRGGNDTAKTGARSDLTGSRLSCLRTWATCRNTFTRPSSTMADAQVFEETFSITSINNEKYDRVSRIFGTSTDRQITMSLDINHELFPVEAGQTLSLVLATTLALDGTAKGDNDSMWRSVGKQGVTTLADMYDYVCYGKNYRMEGGDGDIM
jgi:DNA-directed RNA polymerase I, II, and III subunit RPABC3